jgi:hypothetical protein
VNITELQEIARLARVHADNMKDDIDNALNRIEHLRLTRLAMEAEHLATALERATHV